MFERDDLSFRGLADPTRQPSTQPRHSSGPLAAPAIERANPHAGDDDLHSILIGHYRRELDAQYDARLLMERDEDMRDHIQWTDEEIAELDERGQVPTTYNLIRISLNWVLGTQVRARTDYRILPREDAASQHAERKTDLLKYNDDAHHASHHWSEAFADAVTVGLGWMECGHSPRGTTSEPVYQRHESWRNVFHDTAASQKSMADARYLARVKWVDLDAAIAKFPNRRALLEDSAAREYGAARSTLTDTDGDEIMDRQEEYHFHYEGSLRYGVQYTERYRVRMIEMWYRKPAEVPMVVGGGFHGQIFDEWSPGHLRDVARGDARVLLRTETVMHCAIMTPMGLLWDGVTPYRHNDFPLTPIWGYRRGRTGEPYGMVRGIADIQRALNKRHSKAIHALSTSRVLFRKGSVEDPETLRQEAARPDAFIEYLDQEPKIDRDGDLAASHVQLMQIDQAMIQSTSGVTDENLGRETNATSGKAILAKQSEGALTTAIFFEHYGLARRLHGEKLLSLVEQYYTEPKKFRITDSRGNLAFRAINEGLDFTDHITLTKADFVISEQDYRDTMRQAQTEELFELAKQIAPVAPQAILNILDLIVDASDVPNREEIVKRIRQVTGMMDPDADPRTPDPEALEVLKKKAEEMALVKRAKEAEVAEKEAKAAKLLAETRGTDAKTVTTEMESLEQAIQAAVTLLGVQGAAAVADRLLAEARMRSEAPAAPQPPAPPAAMPPPGPPPSAPQQPQPQPAPPMMPPGAPPRQ